MTTFIVKCLTGLILVFIYELYARVVYATYIHIQVFNYFFFSLFVSFIQELTPGHASRNLYTKGFLYSTYMQKSR